MIIIVTDEGRFWNHKNPLLEKYANCVLVVCLGGKKVTDKYSCFISPYKEFHGRGMTDNSILGEKYRALASVENELRYNCWNHEKVLFLTDDEPQSLFPYLVLKDNEKYNQLHLWCMTPLGFGSNRKFELYSELLNDFSPLKSLLYFDSDKMSSLLCNGKNLKETIDAFDLFCADLLPSVICDIGTKMNSGSNYYFDFNVRRYVEVDNSYEAVINASPISKTESDEHKPYIEYCTLGIILSVDYPNDSKYTKQAVEKLHPRIYGKQICEELKKMRRKLAEANNIDIDIVDCPSTGPCAGTCPQCDKEISELQRSIMAIPEEKRVYPKIDIERSCGLPEIKRLDEQTLLYGTIHTKSEVNDDE